MWKPNVNLATQTGSSVWDNTARKNYELNNHLGNVMAVITEDRDLNGGDIKPTLTSSQDYYSFGGQMTGRKGGLAYRYGFNGKENDDEVKGEGNQQDYGMRIYDPRIARFLSEDPLKTKYPMLSPYQFSSNTPIWAVDLDGAEALNYAERNNNGEKQVHLGGKGDYIYSTNSLGIPVSTFVPSIVTPSGIAITRNLSDIEVYKLAFKRFVDPTSNLAKPNEYIDLRLMKASTQLEYFFTHQVPGFSYSTSATTVAHTAIAFGLMNGDASAMRQIQKSDDFSYRYNIAELLSPAVAEVMAEVSLRKALAGLLRIQTRSINLIANDFKAAWSVGDLSGSITKLLGNNANFEITSTGKIVWSAEGSNVRVIQDPLNKYFRIEDITNSTKRNFLDINGKPVPNNKILNGKQKGMTQSEYNELTHFKY